MKQENRDSCMDILRIICCLFIIGLHVSGTLNLSGSLWKLIQIVVRPALWAFMASNGYYD